jgi:long-chain acyl-CoA synthetase
MITSGRKDDRSEKQKRVRAKLTDDSDPSSPYRDVEVLDKLQIQPEKKVHTLAVIPDLCLKRHADKETMGIREILNVEDEKQPNGKIYKKVFFFFFNENNLFK